MVDIRELTSILKLFPACFLSLLIFTPESPRWLVLRGRDEEAIESLRRYLGKGLSADNPLVQDEYKSIKAAVIIEKEANVSLKEVVLCRDRSSHLRRMLLGMGKYKITSAFHICSIFPADRYSRRPIYATDGRYCKSFNSQMASSHFSALFYT